MSNMVPSSSNVVLLAQNLNPSIFSLLWLYKIGVISETEQTGGSIFTPVVSHLITPQIELLVVPERMQLTLRDMDKSSQSQTIKKVCGTIVKTLPHTPFTAIGFNMEWIIQATDKKNFSKIVREMMLSNKNPLVSVFNTDDAHFGMNLSKDELGMRMTLNLLHVVTDKSGNEGLKFSFNFNKPIPEKEKAAEIIHALLDEWTNAREVAEKIVMEGSREWSLLGAK